MGLTQEVPRELQHCTVAVPTVSYTWLPFCPAYQSQCRNVTVTSLPSSRGLHPFLCTEAGAQVPAWPGQSELLDAAYDFGVMRDLYDNHSMDGISFTGLA